LNISEEIGKLSSPALLIRGRTDSIADWDAVISLSQEPSIYLETVFLDYFVAYNSVSGEVADLSVIIYINRKPSAILPLFAIKSAVSKSLCSPAALGIRPPLIAQGCNEKEIKNIIDVSLSWISKCASLLDIHEWKSEEFLFSNGCTPWQRRMREISAKDKVGVHLFLDLKNSADEIFRSWRKSYRNLIKAADPRWKVEVCEGDCDSVMREFQALHITVAERVTRPQETWDLQAKSIREGLGFVVTIRDEGGELVGAALFGLSSLVCAYSVAAYRRDLFAHPLGHLTIWAAVTHAKKLNKSTFYLGERIYSEGTEKEVKISEFKEGFADTFRVSLRSIVETTTEDGR
jgi:FemAB family protein